MNLSNHAETGQIPKPYRRGSWRPIGEDEYIRMLHARVLDSEQHEQHEQQHQQHSNNSCCYCSALAAAAAAQHNNTSHTKHNNNNHNNNNHNSNNSHQQHQQHQQQRGTATTIASATATATATSKLLSAQSTSLFGCDLCCASVMHLCVRHSMCTPHTHTHTQHLHSLYLNTLCLYFPLSISLSPCLTSTLHD